MRYVRPGGETEGLPWLDPTEHYVKHCKCGRSYTLAQWMALPDSKVYVCLNEVHDQRHCPCGSHIVIILAESIDGLDLEPSELSLP